MSNVTITVEDELLRKARIRALEQGTSVNAVLGELLALYAGVRPAQVAAVCELIELSKTVGSRGGDRSWTRDDLHERT